MKKIICLSFLSLVLASSCSNKTKETETAASTTKDSTTVVGSAFSETAKTEAKEKAENYRKKVLSGEITMAKAAELYSEDPGSNKTGGVYKNIARGQFVPEFEKAAFALQPGQISEVFETQYGFHFVQLIALHDNLIDVSHVLVIPK